MILQFMILEIVTNLLLGDAHMEENFISKREHLEMILQFMTQVIAINPHHGDALTVENSIKRELL